MMTSIKALFLAIILLFVTAQLTSQEKETTQYDFGGISAFDEIPKEFQDADAVVIFKEETYSSDFDAAYYKELFSSLILDGDPRYYNAKNINSCGLLTITVHMRVRILTKRGLDLYSFISVINNKNTEIKTLDARTIKSDLTVYDLNPEDIKQVDILVGESYNNKDLPKTRFAIPGLEIGDEVEFIYTISGHDFLLLQDFYFYEDIPVLNSNLTLRMGAELIPKLYYYNGAVHAKSEIEGFYAVYSWQIKNQPAYNNIANARISEELPYVKLIMERISYVPFYMLPNSWNDVFEPIENGFQDQGIRPAKAKHLKTKIEEIKENYPTASNFELFYQFFRYVNDTLELRSLKDWEKSYSSGYYLYHRFCDRHELYKIYIQALKILDVDYNLCLATGKTNTPIDTNIIDPYCFDYTLFQIHNENKSYLMYPSTIYQKYEFDEIPITIEGTSAMVIPNKEKGEKLTMVVLPQGSAIDNFINRKCQLKFVKDSNRVEAVLDYSLSGAASTVYRSKIDKNLLLYKNDTTDILSSTFANKPNKVANFHLDTIFKNESSPLFPFKYRFTVKGNYDKLLTKLDDSTYTLPMTPLLEHNVLLVSDYERLVDYLPNYPRMDMYSYYLVFDKPVQVLNKEAASMSIENKIGSYQMVVEPINNNMLLVTSKYTISSNYVPKEDYALLKELTHAAEDAQNATIIIKY